MQSACAKHSFLNDTGHFSFFRCHGGPSGMNLRFEDIIWFWQRFVKSNWIWYYFEAVWHNSVPVRILSFTGRSLDWKLAFKMIWTFDDLCFQLVSFGVFPDTFGGHFWGYRRAAAQKQRLKTWCEALSSIFGGHGGPSGMNLRFADIIWFWQRFVKSNGIW